MAYCRELKYVCTLHIITEENGISRIFQAIIYHGKKVNKKENVAGNNNKKCQLLSIYMYV